MSKDPAPGRGWYIPAALIAVLGAVFFVYYLYIGVSDIAGSLKRAAGPGESEIVLEKPGAYLVFHEYESVIGGVPHRVSPGVRGMSFAIEEKATGRRASLSPPLGDYSYKAPGRAGAAILTFTITRPGLYVFSSWYDNESGPERVFAIGRGFMARVFVTVITALAILFGSFSAGAALAAFVYHRRRKAEKGAPVGPRPVEPGR
ncbi:MAG: hypothetical protein ACNS63_05855 [Candidatus Nitrospinota bacterium M3_3B_026]